MDPNEKNELVDLIAEAVEATPDGPVENVAEAVEQEVAPEVTEEETTETTEVVEETETAEETTEAVAELPEKSEHDKAVDKELEDLGIKNEKSAKRFRELANEAKENREYRARFEEQDKVFQHMESAGISGEQFGIMTAIAADVNSGDPVREQRAYQALMAEANALAERLGYRTDKHNPLAAHADLAKRVEDGLLDENDALELARARQMQNRQTEFQTQRAERDTQTATINAARDQLTALEAQLKAGDPDYARKRAIVEPLIRAQIQADSLKPEQWAPTFATMYGNVQLPAAPKPAPVVKPAPDNRARPNGAAGKPVTTNTADLIAKGLGLSAE